MMTTNNNKKINFLDTNILLVQNKGFLSQINSFYISSITLEELEDIKISSSKDPDIKYKARKIVNWLIDNSDKYTIIPYTTTISKFASHYHLEDSSDKKIIATALYLQEKEKNNNILFYTNDLNCKLFAELVGIKTCIPARQNTIPYTGYVKVFCTSDEELADFYTKLNDTDSIQKNFLDLEVNQYVLIYDKENKVIDKYKYTKDNTFTRINFSPLESKMFGKVKPVDPLQILAIDSLKTNQLTVIKGPAGSGKSLLSLAYLFKILEEGKIDKIIIFCNTVATAGSAKLGYYPGSRTEKLLDSQIGNFLISKLGARQAVDRLIDEDKLLLLPMSDIRGFDTSGMKAGIYITQAQNLSIDLMKLALQRIGEDSICILDGDDDTQVDLGIYAGTNNGLKRVSKVFRGQDFYGQITLRTIHRSRIANIANKM